MNKPYENYQPRVIVKFRDDIRFPEYVDGAEKYVIKYRLGPWEELAEQFQGITLKRIYVSISPGQIRDLVARATHRDPDYQPPEFLNYYAIDVPPHLDAEALAKQLASWETVEQAYVQAPPAPPPTPAPVLNDQYFSAQGYLASTPDGIDAFYAWLQGGGFGAGIRFADMEQGWTLNHIDLPPAAMPPAAIPLSGDNRAFFGHGTAVLGILLATHNNQVGCAGIAPQATASVVSIWRNVGDTAPNYADAIMHQLSSLAFGDVFLLEAQLGNPALKDYRPVETDSLSFNNIRLATALGVVVVEAAGNGGFNLDNVTDSAGKSFLKRRDANGAANPDFRDSGAIMVGASSRQTPHLRWDTTTHQSTADACLAPESDFSNFGTRIDCYAWGECVETLGDGGQGNSTNNATPIFGGTSAAAAIIAGVAVLTQSIAAASPPNGPLSPGMLRTILNSGSFGTPLANPIYGTPSANPAADMIGVMPDLNKIIDVALNAAPDVYLRDFVGDTGEPHTGPISASPDIIVQTAPVANADAAFGELSPTVNNNALGSIVRAAQDNFVYVRARNRGGSPANSVQATVYWSEVATLITPNSWHLIGSKPIPSVPVGNILTVTPVPITWAAADVPATGHYCFIGVVSHPTDPAPPLANLLTFDNFYDFIRRNNNVTWRNFNVVNNVPLPGALRNAVQLPFVSPGAPDKDRPFQLEVLAALPQDAQLWFEGPRDFVTKLVIDRTALQIDVERQMAALQINPHGLTHFNEIVFPAKSRAPLALYVNIPEEWRAFEFEVFVRQLYKDEEVGRVTWRLSPRED
jgi:hypothetical protein